MLDLHWLFANAQIINVTLFWTKHNTLAKLITTYAKWKLGHVLQKHTHSDNSDDVLKRINTLKSFMLQNSSIDHTALQNPVHSNRTSTTHSLSRRGRLVYLVQTTFLLLAWTFTNCLIPNKLKQLISFNNKKMSVSEKGWSYSDIMLINFTLLGIMLLLLTRI